MIHPRTSAAISDVEATFGADHVTYSEQADGSVLVTVEGADLGNGWAPRIVELSVKLPPSFPDTMPYPWYLPAGLRRTDGTTVERLTETTVSDGIKRSQLSLGGPWTASDPLGARLLAVDTLAPPPGGLSTSRIMSAAKDPKPWSATITHADYASLHRHLFRGDTAEHAAFLLAGTANFSSGGRLLVREVLPVADEDFGLGAHGYRVAPRATTRAARRARAEGLALIWAHSHPGSGGSAGFSSQDKRTIEDAHPSLIDITGAPVAALVLGEGAVAGEVGLPAQRLYRSRSSGYSEPRSSTSMTARCFALTVAIGAMPGRSFSSALPGRAIVNSCG